MNNILTLILTVVIIAGAAVFAVNTRYKVIQGPDIGTVIIDNWEFNTRRIIEKQSSGMWTAVEIMKYKKEDMAYSDTTPSSKKKKNRSPAI